MGKPHGSVNGNFRFHENISFKTRRYEEVARQQVHLTEQEEIALVTKYHDAKCRLHKYILTKTSAKRWFLDLYLDTQSAGKSVAKLNRRFNTRVKGLASSIEGDMIKQINFLGYTKKGKGILPDGAAEMIYDLGPSDWCYSEMGKLIPQTKVLGDMNREVSELEDVLLRSMLMAAYEIAKRCSSSILGIDENDAVQEAQIYFLESIRKYDLNYKQPDGSRVKLCTYAYSRAERLIQEWVLTTSRLVRVPRSKMGRILTVVKAYEALTDDNMSLHALAAEANKIQRNKAVLTDTSTFTTKEVDTLVKILMSNYIHLDQPFNRNNTTTIGEMLSSDEPCVTELIQAQDKKEQLLEVLQDNLEEIEFQIISLRYFHDPTDKVPKALGEIGPLLASVYGSTNYSRESIRKIENVAMAKLQKVREIKRLW